MPTAHCDPHVPHARNREQRAGCSDSCSGQTASCSGASRTQAKDDYTEGDELIDSVGVVNKAAADTSDKTVMDVIILLFESILLISGLNRDKPALAGRTHRTSSSGSASMMKKAWVLTTFHVADASKMEDVDCA